MKFVYKKMSKTDDPYKFVIIEADDRYFCIAYVDKLTYPTVQYERLFRKDEEKNIEDVYQSLERNNYVDITNTANLLTNLHRSSTANTNKSRC